MTDASAALLLEDRNRLRAFASRRLSPPLRARLDTEDLLQEVYLDVARRSPPGDRPGLPWMARILRSKIADAWRLHHAAARDLDRERAPGAGTPSACEKLGSGAAVDTTTPSRIASAREAEGRVRAALASLAPDHRRVLELRFLEGRDLREVSASMERSVPAVQMLQVRALRELRRALEDVSRVGG